MHDLAVLLAVAIAGAAVDGVVGEDEAGEQGQEGGEEYETHGFSAVTRLLQSLVVCSIKCY